MRKRLGVSPRWLVSVPACFILLALTLTGGAVAHGEGPLYDEHGMEQEALVEIHMETNAQLAALVEAGYDVAEYLRHNEDGSLTTQVIATSDELAEIEAAGYTIGVTIEDHNTYLARAAERQAAIDASDTAKLIAEEGPEVIEPELQAAGLRSIAFAIEPAPAIIIQRADYFSNYAGRFISVEAYHTGSTFNTGPTMAVSWRTADGDYGSAQNLSKNNDTDPNPDVYLTHRTLIRVGAVGSTEPVPAFIRVAASNGDVAEGPVEDYITGDPNGKPFPPGFQSHFFDHYMNPTEIDIEFEQIAEDYPNITELIPLPHLTPGYQRLSMATMSGTTAIGNAGAATSSVVLTATKYGHLGGNDIRAQFRNPGVADSPLAVNVVPNAAGQADIIVDLGTSSTGALNSTAAQVVAAINASPAASEYVTAQTWAGNAGGGTVAVRALVNLSDFLGAPSTVPRGPFQVKVLRISKEPNPGNRTGIYIYCQEHAREWVTPLTCYELAKRLVVNYSHDPETTDFVDNLDIFIVPSINPDGSHVSIHGDHSSRRRNIPNYCAPTSTSSMPSGRNSWGVDLNRNNSQYTLFDGYFGASTSCTSDVFAGLSEISEAETKNSHWVVDNFDNIKFSMNTHSSGGYFMWSPASYIGAGRITAPSPNIGIEGYFWKAADITLRRIKEYRGTVIPAQRTGPVADVLYSAAGNSADDYFYRKGIIAYSFEVGADRMALPLLQVASVAGAPGVRATTTAGMSVGNEIRIDVGKNLEVRTITQIITPNPSSPNPNVMLDAPLDLPHVTSTQLVTPGTSTGSTVGVGFMPSFAVEGQYEGMEFANGHYGLLEAALEYDRDTEPPLVTMTGDRTSSGDPIRTTFEWVNEPSVIRYTVDGSMPTEASPTWEAIRPRSPGEVFLFDENTTVRWLAEDIKGNTSRGVARFSIGEQYTFSGFRAPVLPGVNERTAGAAVPVKFAISGHSSPSDVTDVYSESANCETGEAAWTGIGSPDESFSAVTVASNGQYQVDWKTSRSWKGTCRALVLVLSDNTEHTAFFRFK